MLDPDKSPRFNVPGTLELHIFIVDNELIFMFVVAQMGNYQEYLAKQPKLRPLFEDESKERENAFGSPFRLKKKTAVMSEYGDVDEIRDVGFVQTKKRPLEDGELPKAKRQALEIEKAAPSSLTQTTSSTMPLSPSLTASTEDTRQLQQVSRPARPPTRKEPSESRTEEVLYLFSLHHICDSLISHSILH